jgi:hypothetical protein
MNYQLKYQIAVDLIKKGYIIHCTNEIFNSFDSSYIKGGSRAKEGYGFYFTDMPYKPIEYGDNFKVVKKSAFNFLDSKTPLSHFSFFNNIDIKSEIYKLENLLYSVRSNREYDEIEKEINRLKDNYENYGGDRFFDYIKIAIEKYNAKTIGNLEYYVPNPDFVIPKLIKLYIEYGFDGYVTDGIYTIFNFDKLNKNLINVDTKNYNLNESFDTSSLKAQKTLHPDFWENDTLDSRVRLKLLDIADDFTDFLNIDWVKSEDITMTGSLANYNWSKEHSDIDLHIIIDYKKIDSKIEFVKEYLKSKKELWNKEHQNISIYGFPVELYVQDKNEPHASSGVYSLETNKWIVKPERKEPSKQILTKAEEKAEDWAEKIDKILNRYFPNSTESQKEGIIDDLDKTFQKIKNTRKNGFKKGGDEFNQNNLTFKILRRNGYIDKILNKKTEIYDNLMSINEGCWGYDLFDNDDVLDKQNEFDNDIIDKLINKLNTASKKQTPSGSDKFSWFAISFDFLKYCKDKEIIYTPNYQILAQKCYDSCNELIASDFTKNYSNPEKMKQTLINTSKELEKIINKISK